MPLEQCSSLGTRFAPGESRVAPLVMRGIASVLRFGVRASWSPRRVLMPGFANTLGRCLRPMGRFGSLVVVMLG